MFSFIGKSQIFVSLCALFLCAETLLISGLSQDLFILSVVFFAALFIYNAAQLNLVFSGKFQNEKSSITISGNNFNVIICLFSFIIVFVSLTFCNSPGILVFIMAALLSVIYMMPFTVNGIRKPGLRNNIYFKNIILSLIWALVTVIFPIIELNFESFSNATFFIFARHFLFIYALTVVFDIRDIDIDRQSAMNTIALKFGEQNAKKIALAAMLIFTILIYADPELTATTTGKHVAIALYISALISGVIIAKTNKYRKSGYFSYVVDGTIIIQFFLAFIFTRY